MALRKIFKDGEAVLKKKAKTVTRFDSRLALLVDDMTETLKDANGVGLAAPQVGILKRVMVIDGGEDAGVVELINPVITQRAGEQVFYEGCLSYPGYYGNVGRPEEVTVRAFSRSGEAVEYRAGGLYAVACCHEADHLDGLMFMRQVKGRLYTLDEVKKMRGESEAQAAQRQDGDKDAAGAAKEANGADKGGVDEPNGATAGNDKKDSSRDGYFYRVDIL